MGKKTAGQGQKMAKHGEEWRTPSKIHFQKMFSNFCPPSSWGLCFIWFPFFPPFSGFKFGRAHTPYHTGPEGSQAWSSLLRKSRSGPTSRIEVLAQENACFDNTNNCSHKQTLPASGERAWLLRIFLSDLP